MPPIHRKHGRILTRPRGGAGDEGHAIYKEAAVKVNSHPATSRTKRVATLERCERLSNRPTTTRVTEVNDSTSCETHSIRTQLSTRFAREIELIVNTPSAFRKYSPTYYTGQVQGFKYIHLLHLLLQLQRSKLEHFVLLLQLFDLEMQFARVVVLRPRADDR